VTNPTGIPEGLTAFQVEVAQMFFSLPASYGFLLAGGAALAAQKLTTRPTQDLDFFTGPNRGDVLTARDAFEAAALGRGWSVRRVRDTATFWSGSPGALPRRGPLRTVRATRRGTRLKQAARACRIEVLCRCAGGLSARGGKRCVRGGFGPRPDPAGLFGEGLGLVSLWSVDLVSA
jgi:hypothetical protein